MSDTTPLVALDTVSGPRDERSAMIASSEGAHRAAVAAFESEGRERVLVAFHDPRAMDAGSGMAFAWSDDGGAHWTGGAVPVADRQPQGLGPMITEPTVAVSPVTNDRHDTDVFFAAVASVPTLPSALHRQIVISRSIDGGRTFLPAIVAAAPRVTDRFQTADHPSLAVDTGGRVHLVFVADAGLPTEGLRHWIGYPGSTGCLYSCMSWQPQDASIDPQTERHAIGAAIVRTMRNALYLVYEQLAPNPEDSHNAFARIIALRYDPFMHAWTRMSSQPSRGRWFHVPALAETPTGTVSAGRHVDFAIEGQNGFVTWSEIGNDGSSSLVSQSFVIVDVLDERWNDAEEVLEVPAGTRILQPTLALRGDGVPTVSWFEQRAGTATTSLHGSARTSGNGAMWSAARDLASIQTGPQHVACGTTTPWIDQLAAIGLGGTTPMTLTVHADELCADDAPISTAVLAATRWSAD